MVAELIEFAHTLSRGYAMSDALHDLTGRAAETLGSCGAAVSLREGGALRFVTAGREDIARLERLQELHQCGPSVDAVNNDAPVIVREFTHEERERWPAFVAAVTQTRIAAVASFPMRHTTGIGALDLFDTAPREWTQDELGAASVFSDIATAYVLNASTLERHKRTAEQLQHALTSRIVIEQAKGILSGERGITVDSAFELMRKHANSHNARLRDVACAVVHLGLRPTA